MKITNWFKPTSTEDNTAFSQNLRTLRIFTDGSTINNGKKYAKGGYGVYFEDNNFDNISMKYTQSIPTNQKTELKACIEALKNIPANKYLISIYTDSQYVINCMTKWITNWRNNGWMNAKKKPVLNKDLIQELYQLYIRHKPSLHHVNSHMPEPSNKNSDCWKIWNGNDQADMLAKMGGSQAILN